MKIRKLLLPVLGTLAGVFVVCWLISRTFFWDFYRQPSESMLPTLQVGDWLIISKWGYGNYQLAGNPIYKGDYSRHPQRGEIFIFKPPHDRRYFIKRVIGVPGDIVEVMDNVVSVNGVEADLKITGQVPGNDSVYRIGTETINGINYSIRIRENIRTPQADGRWEVPQGHYFVLGDNRDNSQDSRYWGFVPRENFAGKLVYSSQDSSKSPD